MFLFLDSENIVDVVMFPSSNTVPFQCTQSVNLRSTIYCCCLLIYSLVVCGCDTWVFRCLLSVSGDADCVYVTLVLSQFDFELAAMPRTARLE